MEVLIVKMKIFSEKKKEKHALVILTSFHKNLYLLEMHEYSHQQPSQMSRNHQAMITDKLLRARLTNFQPFIFAPMDEIVTQVLNVPTDIAPQTCKQISFHAFTFYTFSDLTR